MRRTTHTNTVSSRNMNPCVCNSSLECLSRVRAPLPRNSWNRHKSPTHVHRRGLGVGVIAMCSERSDGEGLYRHMRVRVVRCTGTLVSRGSGGSTGWAEARLG